MRKMAYVSGRGWVRREVRGLEVDIVVVMLVDGCVNVWKLVVGMCLLWCEFVCVMKMIAVARGKSGFYADS